MCAGACRIETSEEVSEDLVRLRLDQGIVQASRLGHHSLGISDEPGVDVGVRPAAADRDLRDQPVELDGRRVLCGAVLGAQRPMTVERLERVFRAAEIDVRVGKAEQDRAPEANRCTTCRCEVIGSHELAMRTADVASSRHRMRRIDDSGPGDGQRLARRLRRGDGSSDVASRRVDVTAQPELIRQVLTRDHLAIGVAQLRKCLRRPFVQINRSIAPQLVERQVGEHERRPWMLRIAGAQRDQTTAHHVQLTPLQPHLAEAHQLVVRPGLSRTGLAADKSLRVGGSNQAHAADQSRAQQSRRRGRRSHRRSQLTTEVLDVTCQPPPQLPSAPPPEDGIWSMGTAHGGSVLIVNDAGS